MNEESFSIEIAHNGPWDPFRDQLDVEVRFTNGKRYGATFLTLENIRYLLKKNAMTDGRAGPAYVWVTNRILVEILTWDLITRTVHDLIEHGGFEQAFASRNG